MVTLFVRETRLCGTCDDSRTADHMKIKITHKGAKIGKKRERAREREREREMSDQAMPVVLLMACRI